MNFPASSLGIHADGHRDFMRTGDGALLDAELRLERRIRRWCRHGSPGGIFQIWMFRRKMRRRLRRRYHRDGALFLGQRQGLALAFR